MNERGWFTLMVRALGLWFVVTGASQMMWQINSLIYLLFPEPQPGGGFTNYRHFIGQGLYALGELLQLGAGLYLTFRAQGLISRFCREVTSRCACGYPLAAAADGRCPECGVVTDTPASQPGERPERV